MAKCDQAIVDATTLAFSGLQFEPLAPRDLEQMHDSTPGACSQRRITSASIRKAETYDAYTASNLCAAEVFGMEDETPGHRVVMFWGDMEKDNPYSCEIDLDNRLLDVFEEHQIVAYNDAWRTRIIKGLGALADSSLLD